MRAFRGELHGRFEEAIIFHLLWWPGVCVCVNMLRVRFVAAGWYWANVLVLFFPFWCLACGRFVRAFFLFTRSVLARRCVGSLTLGVC